MLVKESTEVINSVVDALFTFVREDEEVVSDFMDYLNLTQVDKNSVSQVQSVIVPYVFERRIGKERRSIIDIYRAKTKGLKEPQKAVLNALEQAMYSVFEVKKILKHGFELYNLVNELTCTALSMTKMTQFKGTGVGQFMVARVFPFEDEYYLLEINEVMSSYNKEKAYRYAVAKQMAEPELIYKNNDAKLNEIEQLIYDIGQKFKEFFNTDEIITSSKSADQLIGCFNDYIESTCPENGAAIEQDELQSLINPPETHGYFEVRELTSRGQDFLATAARGFSSHEKAYDVGVVYDFELGLLIVPFYGTFKKIFENDDYKSIDGYKECVMSYLNSPEIPPSIFKKVSAGNPDRFIAVINEVTGKEYSLDSLLAEYKQNYFNNKKFSSTTVLYSSRTFNELMSIVSEEPALPQNLQTHDKVGRNDECPCGSGKKYKKCCLK